MKAKHYALLTAITLAFAARLVVLLPKVALAWARFKITDLRLRRMNVKLAAARERERISRLKHPRLWRELVDNK